MNATSINKSAEHAPNPHLLRRGFLSVEDVLDKPIIAFLRLRRMARSAHEISASYSCLASVGERTKRRLEKSPFNAHRIEQLEGFVAALRAELRQIRKHVEHIGAVLADLAPSIDAITTLDQRLELLNCNPADRAEIEEADVSMLVLMAAYCVEDSAEHRCDEWNDRPLHAAVNAEMQRVMFRTPEGREASDKLFNELFEPGGLFEKVPRYYRQPDGTMLRQGPPLTVHDENGSHTVERKPS